MNDIEILLKEVKESLHNNETVKEYFRLKEIIEHDEEIKQLEKDIRHHQKKMCEYQNNDELYFKEKAIYEELSNKLESNPVYVNFNEVKSEINTLLIDIRDFLS